MNIMNIFGFKKGLCGLLLSLMVVLILGQISFASDMRDIQRSVSIKIIGDNGNFGLGCVKFKGKAGREFKKLLKFRQSVVGSGKPIDIYAAYTSYQANLDPLKNVYWPWVYPNQAFLYVAFKVNTLKSVDIKWDVYKFVSNTWSLYSRSVWNFDNQILDPNNWYFAWWQPSGTDIPLTEGYYRLTTTVSINKWKSSNDGCYFQVLPAP